MRGCRVSLRGSVAARLAVGYGLMVAASIATVSIIFYFATVGRLEGSIDAKISSISGRMVAAFQRGGQAELAREIEIQLNDRVDSDTEILLVLGPHRKVMAGNLRAWTGPLPPQDHLIDRTMLRDGKAVSTRLITRQLADGARLFVGRDLSELSAIRAVILQALLAGSVVSMLAVFGGAIEFRRQIEKRIAKIRRTANAIEGGDLTRRIAMPANDEFGRLGRDINRMLDRIELLMKGVRDVSNAIAHDLRTPLTRLRSRLEEALNHATDPAVLAEGARGAIDDVDGLIIVFEKLLQIATAESGVLTTSLVPVDLREIATDIAELYEAVGEEQGTTVMVSGTAPVYASADRDLLGSALSNLVDNALKYAGAGGKVEIEVRAETDAASLIVRDDGPGVAAPELEKLSQRFYRVDRSRNLPGNGLGLSIVSAIARLHGGRLLLQNRQPGLEARIELQRVRPQRS